MKVCLVSPYDISQTGGVTNHIVNYANELELTGIEVTILSTSSNINFKLDGIEIINLGKPVPIKFGSTVANIFLSWKSLFKIYSFFKKNRFDIVHIHEPLVPFISIFSLIFCKNKTVLTFHSTIKKSWMFKAWGFIFKPWLNKKDCFIAVSKSAKDSLLNYNYNLDVEIHPNGVANALFKNQQSQKKDILKILFVGRNEERKGVEILLQAFQIMKKNNIKKSFELVLIGQDIDKFINKYPSIKQCKFIGHTEGEKLYEHYFDADILCAPSIENESFGIILIEAMASKNVVIASDISGYKELIDNKNGILFKNKDANDLANKLTLLIENDNLRFNLKNYGYEFSKNYKWEYVAKKIFKTYKKL
tara:strand:+ start:1087 stop:2172 length:1086 start_codon:yes stop_codon:yes gene_type:complete